MRFQHLKGMLHETESALSYYNRRYCQILLKFKLLEIKANSSLFAINIVNSVQSHKHPKIKTTFKK
jgi:hypothetical protein